MFKIVKKSAWNEQAHEVATLREANARLSGDITLCERANVSLRDKISSMEGLMGVQRTRINACQDTKKYLKGQLEERFATIDKLKKELADTQFQLKVARKEVEIPTSSDLNTAALPAEVVPTPQPAQKRKRTYTKRAGGKK
jgi:chromosome segregation ATPase